MTDQALEPAGEFIDDKIVKMSIAGHPMKVIARALDIAVKDVEEVLTAWSREYMPPELRRHRLALNLARIEQAIAVLHPRVLQGELPAIKAYTDLIRRQSVMLGLHAPREAVLRIVEEPKPAHPHHKLMAALEALDEDARRRQAAAAWNGKQPAEDGSPSDAPG